MPTFQAVGLGAQANDGTGTPARDAFGRVNANFSLVSTTFDAFQIQINGKVGSANPTFSGTVTIPTPTAGDASTKAASTQFVATALGPYATTAALNSAVAPLAPINSPPFTGTPTAPTPIASDNSTKLSTTAWVRGYVAGFVAPFPSGSEIGGVRAEYATWTVWSGGTVTVVPFDDTIPTNTEGTELMTVTYTPTDAADYLDIEFDATVSAGASAYITASLFIDSGAAAVATNLTYIDVGNSTQRLSLKHRQPAGSLSARTYRIRLGPNSATTFSINGTGTARLYGGVMKAILSVKQKKA